MGKRKYIHVEGYEPVILQMRMEGKTRREIAEHLGFRTVFGLCLQMRSVLRMEKLWSPQSVECVKGVFIRPFYTPNDRIRGT